MRLINADELMELYDGCDGLSVPIAVVQQNIKDATTIDAEPMRHGRWVDKPLIKSFKHTNIPVVECSACGIDFCDIINNHYFMYKYCPNCGAKMDGGKVK